MKISSTSERLKEYQRLTGDKQIDILRKCEPYCKKYNVKMGRNDISQYISGRFQPKQDKLFILGNALNVSEAWLMGFDVPMSRENSKNRDRLKNTIDNFSFTDEEIEDIIKYIEFIISKRKWYKCQKILIN